MGGKRACTLLEIESQLSFVLKHRSFLLATKRLSHYNPCGIGKGTDSKQGTGDKLSPQTLKIGEVGRDTLGVPGGWVPRNTENSISKFENIVHGRFHYTGLLFSVTEMSETCLSLSACVSAMLCVGPRCSYLGSLLVYSEKKQDKNV